MTENIPRTLALAQIYNAAAWEEVCFLHVQNAELVAKTSEAVAAVVAVLGEMDEGAAEMQQELDSLILVPEK